jgi:putative membrane protein
MSEDEGRFDVQPTVGNHFAWMRTMLGLQRTLMAAVRTAVSLIGFGFTVAQFFEKMRDKMPEGVSRLGGLNAPRDLGLILIGAGIVSLLLFIVQYHVAVAHLRSGDFQAIAARTDKSLNRPTFIVAYAVLIIGVAAFVSVFERF